MQLSRGAFHRVLQQADSIAEGRLRLLIEALDRATDHPDTLFGGGRITRKSAGLLLAHDSSYQELVRERLPYASANELASLRRLLEQVVPSGPLAPEVGNPPDLPFPQAEAQGSWTGQQGS